MRTLVAITLLVFLFSCGNEKGNTPPDSVVNDSSAVKTSAESGWKELTESWNASLNLRNASIMKSFYADSVQYYGDHLSSDDVVRRQQEYFDLNEDYKQKIEEYIDVIQQPDGSWLVKIMKQVTANGKTANYPASLVYAKTNGIWKIVAESDDITDLNNAKSLQVKYAPEISTIEGLLEENTTFGRVTGGDPKSDAKIPYYVVWTKHPLDVIASTDDEKKGWFTEVNVERIQLNGDLETIKKLLNHKVRITGKLEHATTEDHYTKVFMNVDLIEEAL
ncbi:MAG TPA: DUF4431 domain-containing protein [Bacteroidia bacterium]|nr:DUF4431 domain-containing protein [Bacteroidia bacterium]